MLRNCSSVRGERPSLIAVVLLLVPVVVLARARPASGQPPHNSLAAANGALAANAARHRAGGAWTKRQHRSTWRTRRVARVRRVRALRPLATALAGDPSAPPRQQRRRPRWRHAGLVVGGVRAVVGGMRGLATVGLRLSFLALRVTGVASLGLAAHAAWSVTRARNSAERADALRDLGYGLSGLGRLGYLASHVSLSLGLLGAGLQSAVGGYGLFRGLALGDREKITLGGLDVGGGLLFGASLLWFNPWTLGAAVAVTAGRALYAHREGIRSTLSRLRDRLRRRRRDKEPWLLR